MIRVGYGNIGYPGSRVVDVILKWRRPRRQERGGEGDQWRKRGREEDRKGG